MDNLELQKWVRENRENLKIYKEYLEMKINDLVGVHFDNIRDREMDLVNKGKIQLLSHLIQELKQ